MYQILCGGMLIATFPLADADDDFGPGGFGLFLGPAVLGFLGTGIAFISAHITKLMLRGRWHSVRMRTVVSAAVAAMTCGLLTIPLSGSGIPAHFLALGLLAAVTPGWAVVVPGALLVSQILARRRHRWVTNQRAVG